MTFDEFSDAAPALGPTPDGRVALAWRGRDNDALNLQLSTDRGETFLGDKDFGQSSRHGPALAMWGTAGLIAWTDNDDHLNIARIDTHGVVVGPRLDDRSYAAPALAVVGSDVFMAWRSAGNEHVNLAHLTQSAWGTYLVESKVTYGEQSARAPALTEHAGMLFMSWAGTDRRLHVARVATALTHEGRRWVGDLVDRTDLDDWSDAGPALTSHRGRLFLAWRGSGNETLNISYSEDDAATFRGKKTLAPKSYHAPALLSDRDERLLLAYTDTDLRLHVDQVRFVPTDRHGGFEIQS